jgi:hypothetical protein
MAGSERDWRYIGHLLACRSGSLCEGCGKPLVPGARELSIHHRQPRGMGGTDRSEAHFLSNLLLLCAGSTRRLAGVAGCHGAVEAYRENAERRGLLVRHGLDPAAEPVTLASGRRVLLADDGPFYLPPADGPLYGNLGLAR